MTRTPSTFARPHHRWLFTAVVGALAFASDKTQSDEPPVKENPKVERRVKPLSNRFEFENVDYELEFVRPGRFSMKSQVRQWCIGSAERVERGV